MWCASNRSVRFLTTVAVCGLLLAESGYAQKKRKTSKLAKDTPGVQVFKDAATKKKTREKRKGPVDFATPQKKRERLAAVKLAAAIQTANEMLEFEDPTDPDYPLILVKIADLFWQKSEYYFDQSQSNTLLEAIFQAEEQKNKPEVTRLQGEQKRLLSLRRQWQFKAVEQYRKIESNFPDYKDLDEVLYAIGHNLTLIGQPSEAYKYYQRLVREMPESQLVPDAQLNIGDYFFALNQFDEAIRYFDKVRQWGVSRVQGIAMYKTGWCFFNLGQKDKALNSFLATVRWTASQKAKGLPNRLDLQNEALSDMVEAYSYIGSPVKSVGFFKKIAPKYYVKLCERLSTIYRNDANYTDSTALLRKLIKVLAENDHRTLKYRRQVVYNTFRSGDKVGLKAELKDLTNALESTLDSMPIEDKKAEMLELEEVLGVIGTDYHREAEKTLDKSTQLLALYVYEQYLKWFPDAQNYYTMNYNVAILGFQMGEYGRAARLFERVIELRPEGQFAVPAAHTVLLSYFKMVNVVAPTEKSVEEEDEYEEQEIPATETLLVNACARYIKMAPESADDVAEAKYTAAQIYYDYNYFDKSRTYLEEMYRSHREHPSTPEAARLLLSVFNVTRDIQNLEKWAEIFSQDPVLASGDLGEVIKEIRAARDFNRCRQMEFDKNFEKAGDCFMNYYKSFPQSRLGDRALNNAAIMYRNAKLIDKALEASEHLYYERGDSPIAPQALYNVATIYKAIAAYTYAADNYELYAKNHPKHNPKRLEKALKRAAAYRQALGHYDKAISAYNEYFKRFPGSKDAPLIAFKVGLIFENQFRWSQVVVHYRKYLKNYGDKAKPEHVIAAHSKIGKAYWNMKKKKKQAHRAFDMAIELFNQFAKKAKGDIEIDVMGADAVAEAKFRKGETVLARMKAIRLKLPQKKFNRLLTHKLDLIVEATKILNEVAAFKRPHWEIAAYNRIGQAYENLSAAIESAPIPRRLGEEARMMVQEDFFEKANKIRSQAIEAYQLCLERSREKQWFNQYSDNAEKHLARLDLSYKFTRELRPQPVFQRANSSVPVWQNISHIEKLSQLVSHARSIRDWSAQGDQANDLIRRFSDLASSNSEANVAATFNVGLIHERLREFDAALQVYKGLIQRDGDFAPALGRAGAMLLRLGRGGANTYLAQAMAKDAHNATANNVRASDAHARGAWEEVVGYSRKTLIGTADDMNAYQNLARTYLAVGQKQIARLVCEQALEIDPHNASIHNTLGLVWIRLGDVRKAIRSFARAVENDSALVEARLNYGSVALNYSDFSTAREQFRAGLVLEPGNVDATMGNAIADRGLNDLNEAQEGYEKVLGVRPNSVNARYNLCILHGEYQERYADALARCEEFLRIAPATHPKMREVKKRIKGLNSTIEVLRMEQEEAAEAPADTMPTPVDSKAEGKADSTTESESEPPVETAP
jgi:tetratricopeptide (TPR) repeat protein